MTSTFDLLTEPWIPVVRADGAADEIGIREALLQAHTLVEIRDPLPILEFGVYRLLVAIVLDALQPRNWQDLGDLLEARQLPEVNLRRYLDRHAERFHLFGSRPFLQDSGLQDAERKSIALLNPAIPSGTNAIHFHRRHESEFAVCPAVAARLICAIPAFMTMGGAGLSPSINGAPPWYVMVLGANLFETLVLNANTLWGERVRELGSPAWRRDGPAPTGKQKSASALEALTWQPRRVLLFPDGTGRCALSGSSSPHLIRTMAFVAGAGIDFVWEHDPSVAYRRTTDGLFPLRPQEGRELWRDTGALAMALETPKPGQEGVVRPAVVEQFARLCDNDYLKPRELRLRAYGMRTDLKTKVFEWQREELALPPAISWNSAASNRAMRCLMQAEQVSSRLRSAIKKAYPREGDGNKSAFETLVVSSRTGYWQALREPYSAYLHALIDTPERADDLDLQWELGVLKEGEQALDAALAGLDADAASLRRQSEARRFFRSAAWRVFHPEPKTKARKSSAAAVTPNAQGEKP